MYIRVADTNPSTLAGLRAAHARIVHVDDRYKVVTAEVAPEYLDGVGEATSVRSVREALRPLVYGARSVGRSVAGSGLAIRPSGRLAQSLVRRRFRRAMRSLVWTGRRALLNVDGSDVTVGIISDSFDADPEAATHALADVASGDLPGPGNPCGRTKPVTVLAESPLGGVDEGRAMAQIVHDLAPGAQMRFVAAPEGMFEFAAWVRHLEEAGVGVIVDDIAYLDEPFFQDNPIGAAISEVTGRGSTYFTAAGNGNVAVDGHDAGSYEAPSFRPTMCPVLSPPIASDPTTPLTCHDFDPGAGSDAGNQITLAPGGNALVSVQWNEPWNGVTTDLDLFIADSVTHEVVSSSVEDSLQLQQPAELAFVSNDTPVARSYDVIVSRFVGAGVPRLKVATVSSEGVLGVERTVSQGGDVVGPTIFGHSGTRDAVSVAAVGASNVALVEPYSSRGPVTLDSGPLLEGVAAAPLSNPQVIAKGTAARSRCQRRCANDLLWKSRSWRCSPFCGNLRRSATCGCWRGIPS